MQRLTPGTYGTEMLIIFKYKKIVRPQVYFNIVTTPHILIVGRELCISGGYLPPHLCFPKEEKISLILTMGRRNR